MNLLNKRHLPFFSGFLCFASAVADRSFAARVIFSVLSKPGLCHRIVMRILNITAV